MSEKEREGERERGIERQRETEREEERQRKQRGKVTMFVGERCTYKQTHTHACALSLYTTHTHVRAYTYTHRVRREYVVCRKDCLCPCRSYSSGFPLLYYKT